MDDLTAARDDHSMLSAVTTGIDGEILPFPPVSWNRLKSRMARLDTDYFVSDRTLARFNRQIMAGGNERITGTPASDLIIAIKGEGRNLLVGRGGDDRILVGQFDRALGQGGDDLLDARRARQRNGLSGGTGEDQLYAGQWGDYLKGGAGADQFWLATRTLPRRRHQVWDFQPGRDRLGFKQVDGVTGLRDLSLMPVGSHTVIRAQGKAIARLRNISPDQLRADDFIFSSPDIIPVPDPPGSPAGSDASDQLDNPSDTDPVVNPPDDAGAGSDNLPDPPPPPEGSEEFPIFASYRKDYFFPNEIYDEDTPEPLTGGRIQIAAIAQTSGRVNNVLIDGVEWRVIYEANPTEPPPFEWVHVWPPQAQVGEPIWINFHSRDGKWDASAESSIQVATPNGLAVDGMFPVQQTPVPLTYVTTTDDYSRLLIHAQNTDTVPHRVEHLWVNGEDVLAIEASGNFQLPNRELAAGSHALWQVPLSAPLSPGDAWTVVVEYATAPAAVGTGRVIPEFFPIMAWNNTPERPFPSGIAENYQNIRNAGIDTIYINSSTCADGVCDPYAVINDELANLEGFGAFIDYDPFVAPARNFTDFTDTSGIVAVMTGDESDDRIYDFDTGIPIPALKAQESRRSWLRYPELPTFNGGKTNKLIGSFAGMSDIQGMDFYTAACAPHITAFGQHPPLRATFDYLRNARNNHMPLPTWSYTQGLSPVWNRTPLLGGEEIIVQPDPQEILVQGMMAIAAGAKGLAWFQVNQNEATRAPERWQAITDINRMVGAVRSHLREGDVTGAATADATTLVELIQAPEALIVPVISLDTVSGPTTDLECLLVNSSEDVPHWTFNTTTPDVTVTIPPGFDVMEVFEVQPQGIANISYTDNNQNLLFEDVTLDNDMPVRLLVVAADPAVRSEISSYFG
jgi:hypothetical protein